MEENGVDKDSIDEVMLPGFRFHPSDEELVGFYLRRKVQQKPLSIEIIKQLDIYKYDPWDLPDLAATGEKEWYFYSPRDRKYRNSARPNRVTGAGFWKATGTDRPIYSSEGSKCIGLKKSLVFYKGRAAKGIKTDWMMHEFRLPSTSDLPKNKFLDRNKIPANEAWAICRIFKKANTNAQRALSSSHDSWISPAFNTADNISNTMMINPNVVGNFQFRTTPADSSSNTLLDQCSFYSSITTEHSSITGLLSPTHLPSAPCKQVHMDYKPCPVSHSTVTDHVLSYPSYSILSSNATFEHAAKCAIDDASSLFVDMSSSMAGDFVQGSNNLDYNMLHEQYFNSFAASLTEDIQGNLGHEEELNNVLEKSQLLGQILDETSVIFPHSNIPQNLTDDALKSDLLWDSSPCPSDYSTNYSTNKCYVE